MFRILNVKVENGLHIFRPFSTFLLLIWNILNSKFGLNRIWSTAQVIQPNYRLLTTQLRSFYWWLAALSYRRRPASSFLLCIWSCTCLMVCTVGRYFVLNFHIPTVFDIIPLELFRFWKSRYSVSSCSFLCPACPLLLSLSYFKCKSRKQLRSFSTEFDRFHPYCRLQRHL